MKNNSISEKWSSSKINKKSWSIPIGALAIAILACSFLFDDQYQSGQLKIGDQIPGFVLKDQNGNEFDSKEYLGKQKMVIFFYPKDESSLCTKEACAFRDRYHEYQDAEPWSSVSTQAR